MKCKLLVFRHSETFDNRRGIFSGWRDSTLTPKGTRQAKVIAEQLKLCKIDYAFTSHLKRAKQTLKLVLKDRKPTPVFTDDRLIERCYGLPQGKKKEHVEDEDPNFYEQCHMGYTLAPPGESLLDGWETGPILPRRAERMAKTKPRKRCNILPRQFNSSSEEEIWKPQPNQKVQAWESTR